MLLVRTSSSPEGGDGKRAGSPQTAVASAACGPPDPISGKEDEGAAAWREVVMPPGGARRRPERAEWPPGEGTDGGAAAMPKGSSATSVCVPLSANDGP